ncbi:hypothetical protein QFC21_007117 [Naganishia friedmannii]|uniref:Uncharacterized protein n=1 Tax=Naganishia friedmannii TaxID=89922 RepID=A0ACC2UY57_9TREE|nr:hypothetical protein QFC21_007117 [Naganishia friedmannii]
MSSCRTIPEILAHSVNRHDNPEKVSTDASPSSVVATLPEEVKGRFVDHDESPQVKQTIVIGLLVMMWPILTKVREASGTVQNYAYMASGHCLPYSELAPIGPFVQQVLMVFYLLLSIAQIMLAVAWATLPDLPTYRTGVIMVGLARQLAHGDGDYCAIIVIINSILQIILYSPMCLLFINVISNETELKLQYGQTAIAVLIYLGIPLVAGIITRFVGIMTLGSTAFHAKFLPYFGPLALIGLLYTIILIFAEQATRILDNIGAVFRVFVPMILYFLIMWSAAFGLIYYLSIQKGGSKKYGYKMAVVQSFTAGSNNFELAIAVAIAVYGVNSDQALAATIGPLVEVPVLLALTYLALWFQRKLDWSERVGRDVETGVEQGHSEVSSSVVKQWT